MKDLTQGDELKTIFYFSLPILIGNLFQQLYNVADRVIVGNFLGKESLAAVGFSYQINFLLLALPMGISMGTSVLVSRYFGARVEKADQEGNRQWIFIFGYPVIHNSDCGYRSFRKDSGVLPGP